MTTRNLVEVFAHRWLAAEFRCKGLSQPFLSLVQVASCLGAGCLTILAAVRLLHWISAALLALFLATLTNGQQAAWSSLSVEPETEILKAAEAYRAAVLKADVEEVAKLYREDAVEMPFFQPPIIGRAAIAQFYQGQFKSPVKVTAFTFSHTETAVNGDIAYDVGSYKRTMTGAPSGTMEAAGTYVVILKRTDSAWKIAYIIYTCDCAPVSALR